MFDLTILHNFDRLRADAARGLRIVNNTQAGTERHLYKVGQEVCSTGLCTVRFNLGKIVDAYKDNGYLRYVVSFDGQIRICRQKDLRAI